VVALSLSLTQKRWHILHCTMFCASISITRFTNTYDMSSTYFTLRHCKAKPLQVVMEEGPRSKAVCVSGLQYCLYS
jgi:hypothetical protein